MMYVSNDVSNDVLESEWTQHQAKAYLIMGVDLLPSHMRVVLIYADTEVDPLNVSVRMSYI